MRARAQYRQHSKATLVRAAAGLMLEKSAGQAIARRLWLPRVVAAAVGGLVVGLMFGSLLTRMLN